MPKSIKLMAVLAHPDDESLGMGGALAKYAAEGVETYLLTATRGERGWTGKAEEYPGPVALGKIREKELLAATGVLGLKEVTLLDYQDGELDQANPAEIIRQIVTHLRKIRPEIVLTFDPYGAYGHPDHIAICQFTTAAIMAAADPNYADDAGQIAHRVTKLYYLISSHQAMKELEVAFGELAIEVDGKKRHSAGWEKWAVTTQLDTTDYWQQVWQAVSCHHSQLPTLQGLSKLSETEHRQIWSWQQYYRAMSLVNGGRQLETDLLEGLR